MSLLDVTVRTDTKRSLGGRRGARGCVAPVCCDLCGLPLKKCRCRVIEDY